MSCNSVSMKMKMITKRELVRNPARGTRLQPGESLAIKDAAGGLVLRREKKNYHHPQQMEADLNAIGSAGPETDALRMMEDEN